MKLILTSLLSLTVVLHSVGQKAEKDYREQLNFGLKVGGNFSNVYDSEGEDFNADGKFGFAGGAFVTIPLGSFMGVQPEFLFAQRGFKATGSVLGLPYSMTRTTSYIDVPIFFALRPSPYITLLAGPQFSFLTKRKDVFGSGASTVVQETEFSNENWRKNILCFTAGFDITVQQVVIGARVGWDLQNNNGDGTNTTPRYKNTWLQATIGFRI